MKRFTRTIAGKATAAILFVFSLCIATGCIGGAMAMVSSNFYSNTEEAVIKNMIRGRMCEDAFFIVQDIALSDPDNAMFYPASHTNLRFELFDPSLKMIAQSEKIGSNKFDARWDDAYYFILDGLDEYGQPTEDTTICHFSTSYPFEEKNIYELHTHLAEGLPVCDQYAQTVSLGSFAYSMRYAVYPIGIAALLLTIASFITLLCAAARRPGSDELYPGPLNWVPGDLMILCTGIGCVTAGVIAGSLYFSNTLMWILLNGIVYLLIFSAVVGLCMSVAARAKQGTLFTNTVIWRLCKLLWRILRWFGRAFRGIPLIWKTALIVGGLTLLELIVFCCNFYNLSALLLFWFIEKLVLIPVIFYGALTLRKLQKGGEALAEGDLNYQIDTRRLRGDFKRHGENLNSISDGMAHAVEQRMKSERLKTELITNVSHDIKTPLTSIINYADLIAREPSDNEKITEYSGVLLRQSERLKRLINDLVEASKASTGNIEVILSPCEVGVLLTQAVGEYEQRLQEAGLELVTAQPEQPVQIMADGRQLWRVFDNLMNNICKYAQSGTRVYLTLERVKEEAVITFKNISRDALNLSPDELIERFVRGDASRSADGNGLGLSIAKSLTELQKGRLELVIDGDLFKAILRFPPMI